MEIGFPEIVLSIGLLLIVVSGLSGLAHGTLGARWMEKRLGTNTRGGDTP